MVIFNTRMIIPSSINGRNLNYALQAPAKVILLSGVSIGNLKGFVQAIHKQKKQAVVHIDILAGFKADDVGMHLLKNLYHLDGILTSNVRALTQGKHLGMTTVYRLPLIDSLSLAKAADILKNADNYDAVQVLPAICAVNETDHLKHVFMHKPLIASGLIETEDQVKLAFSAGYQFVATSRQNLWSS
ncbi:glycerol-3-phosphate responsive antiterminator [Lacticaseibacillus chiayiensis]|uniref:Glycerol uptake operon antiterminator regulatory protein n=2 Tax=Lacticaseibacillus chiayiensis TaxID=2100821 RepID=A0ABY6H7C5_9LACO|nr:glycerol-3-phosphate responsive antiterminator [Lacticaseibacillus chiayiensis]UYN56364.1 glycerol-3-phosphate responsive antiterminator [Lacticaseibacillus chiayiensis]